MCGKNPVHKFIPSPEEFFGKKNRALTKFLPLLFIFVFTSALQAGTKKDSVPPKDTLALYKKIKKFAYRHKITTLIYRSVFVDPAPQPYPDKTLPSKTRNKDPNLRYKGKIIRSISIRVYDPFGHSVNDTSLHVISPLQKIANGYHITTRARIIRNLLLFKKGDSLAIYKLNESERIIREAPYVNDAHIYLSSNKKRSDSVDVLVVVQDKWSLNAWGGASPADANLTLREKNFLGTGQLFEQSVFANISGDYRTTQRYFNSNISKTFVSCSAFHTETNIFKQAGISFDRPFYSAIAKWAGGIALTQTWTGYETVYDPERLNRKVPVFYCSPDLWLGRSLRLNGLGHANRKISNIIVALRYADTHYQQRPNALEDPPHSFINSYFYLGSAGFSVSRYYKDRFIFRFGANEDIPEGLVVQVLHGLFYREYSGIRYYSGFDISKGAHIERFGYFSVNATYGIYYNRNVDNDATLSMGLTFFTDIIKSRNWYFRQFVFLKYVNGVNKQQGQTITLRPDEMYGFNNGSLAGKNKIIANLETVAYAPYNLAGFKFAPLVLAGFGMLADDEAHLYSGRVYQAYALGLLIRNESLSMNSLKVTFGFYPNLPDGNSKRARLNPTLSFSVKFRSFTVNRPSPIVYE